MGILYAVVTKDEKALAFDEEDGRAHIYTSLNAAQENCLGDEEVEEIVWPSESEPADDLSDMVDLI